jgi:saccharopine dehydrogenase-like NADP-dependent oxidoreductase
MNITVLGGAGKMGCIAVQDLANDQRVDSVTIADLNMESTETVADDIASSKIHIEKVESKRKVNWLAL